MRRALAVIALVAPLALPAQAPVRDARTMRSFESAISVGLGLARFGKRAHRSNNAIRFDYTGSIALDGTFELPLTRRSGIGGGVMLSPLSKVRGSSDMGTIVTDMTLLTVADALLLWRFKPQAPAYFGVGGGYTMAMRSPVLYVDDTGVQWNSEKGNFGAPHGAFVIGFDRDLTQRTGLRMRFAMRFVGPLDVDDPASATVATRSTDFAVTASLRRRRASFR